MPFFVAEIGSNWEGDVEKAKLLINECWYAGANAVKFQMWRAKDLYQGKYKEYELTFQKAVDIKLHCDKLGIEFLCSVFYPEAVDFLETLGVKRYKLASRTMNRENNKDPYVAETVLKVRKTGKPIIYSNGHLYPSPKYSKLYCIPEYPADPAEIDWEEALKCDGFSDHCVGIAEAVKYAKLKPDGIIEKHVKLKDSKGPDAFFSITTQELATLITLSTS